MNATLPLAECRFVVQHTAAGHLKNGAVFTGPEIAPKMPLAELDNILSRLLREGAIRHASPAENGLQYVGNIDTTDPISAKSYEEQIAGWKMKYDAEKARVSFLEDEVQKFRMVINGGGMMSSPLAADNENLKKAIAAKDAVIEDMQRRLLAMQQISDPSPAIEPTQPNPTPPKANGNKPR